MSNNIGQLMMLAGIYLSQDNDSITPIELQKQCSLMAENGFNPELNSCKIALSMLKMGGFLDEIGTDIYGRKYVFNFQEEKKYTPPQKLGMNSLQTPLWAGNI